MVENVLAHHDKELLQHLIDCGINSQVTVSVHSSKLHYRERHDLMSVLNTTDVCVAPAGDLVLRGFDS